MGDGHSFAKLQKDFSSEGGPSPPFPKGDLGEM